MIDNRTKIYDAIKILGGQATLKDLYLKVEELYPGTEERYKDTRSYQASIRATLEDNSSDSERFKGKDDLFFIVIDKGYGIWGLREYEYQINDIQYTQTEIDRVTKVRISQGKFRKDLLDIYERKCPFTQINILSLLIASHIKPWRLDEENRNNPNNGILLSVHLDALFDKGLISLNSGGYIIYKNDKVKDILSKNFILKKNILDSRFLTIERQKFFQWHRQHYNIPENNKFNVDEETLVLNKE